MPEFGWVKNPTAVYKYLDSLAIPNFSYYAPTLRTVDDDGDRFFWELEQQMLGKLLPVWDQGSIGSCFKAGTEIAMGDGTTKNIEQVKIDDIVYSHKKTPCKVTKTFSKDYTGTLYKVGSVKSAQASAVSFATLYCTPEHPFLVGTDWVEAKDLKLGDKLTLFNGIDIDLTVLEKFEQTTSIKVYNLEVEVDNSYFANNVAVHNCVSHGGGKAAEDTLTVQIAHFNLPESWPGYEVAREPIYGGSRCQIGGQYGDYSDGSTGSWCAEWLTKYGVLLYRKYDKVDLSDGYNIQRCKEWGAKGCPKDIEGEARLHPVKDVVQISSTDDCWTALGNWNPINICGNISRTMKRQKGGFCPKVGNDWPHSQALRGRCTVKDGRRAVVYQNSWGSYVNEENKTVELKSGRTIDLPPGTYLSELSEIASDLRQGDTFAYSHTVGFPATTINWYI